MFEAIDAQRMSCYSNKAIVDPVLFRVLYGTGLRISEALKLTISDVDTRAGTLRIRDSKNGAGRTIPITGRLAGTLDAYLTAAHPTAASRATYVFYSRAPGRQINQATIYMRFRGYLADAGIPHFTGGPHPHSLRHGFAVANLRRWAQTGQDLAVMLPYLACYMGHADLRGTQYYLRLTADAYPDVIEKAQIRFGYVIPAAPEDESMSRRPTPPSDLAGRWLTQVLHQLSGRGTRGLAEDDRRLPGRDQAAAHLVQRHRADTARETPSGGHRPARGSCGSWTGWRPSATARRRPATSVSR